MRKRQVPYDITYMGNLIYDTNELNYKTETDSQTQKTTDGYQRGEEVWESDKLGAQDFKKKKKKNIYKQNGGL